MDLQTHTAAVKRGSAEHIAHLQNWIILNLYLKLEWELKTILGWLRRTQNNAKKVNSINKKKNTTKKRFTDWNYVSIKNMVVSALDVSSGLHKDMLFGHLKQHSELSWILISQVVVVLSSSKSKSQCRMVIYILVFPWVRQTTNTSTAVVLQLWYEYH